MAYTAKKTDNSVAAVVNDFESTIVGGLQLLGYGYANYAEEIANDFVRVAENFANTTPPENPLKGQLWWDTSVAGQPALWVCHNPSGAASPVSVRWSKMFQVGAGGNVDAYTLRTYAPSQTSVANTVVVRNSSGKIDSASLPSSLGATNLDGLSDVSTTGKVNGSVLKYNGSSWVAGTASSTSTMNSLTDVDTTGATSGSVLKYNGSQWVVGTDLQGGGSSSVAWGNITGSLSSQTDLQNALNAKAASSHTHSTSQITNLDSTLANKLNVADLLNAIKAIDGAGTGIDADLLDGQQGAYYLNLANATGTLPSSAIITGSLTSNGWAKIGNLVIQWGKYYCPSHSSGDGPFYTNYPTAFPNACFQIVNELAGNPDITNDESDEDFWMLPHSTTQMKVYASGDRNAVYLSWIAIGH